MIWKCFAFGLGVIRVLEVPRGARHLFIQELNGTTHILGKAWSFPLVSHTVSTEMVTVLLNYGSLCSFFHWIAIRNKASGDFFLNAHGDYPETRSVIEKGLEWEYENKNNKDTIQTNGPLKNDVVVMVISHKNSHTHEWTHTLFTCPNWLFLFVY